MYQAQTSTGAISSTSQKAARALMAITSGEIGARATGGKSSQPEM